MSDDELVDYVVGTAASLAETPMLDAIVWSPRDEGYTSYWVRGNAAQGSLIAAFPALLLPAGEHVWRVAPVSWADAEDAPEAALDEDVRLTDVLSATTFTVGEYLEIGDDEPCAERPEITALRPVSSAGPLLLLESERALIDCDGLREPRPPTVIAFDVERREVVPLLSPEERAILLDSERLEDLQPVSGDLHLDFELRYGNQGAMMFFYEVGPEPRYARRGDEEATLTEETLLPAKLLPKSLLPYSVAPPVVANSIGTTTRLRVGGWSLLTAIPEDLETLLESVSD